MIVVAHHAGISGVGPASSQCVPVVGGSNGVVRHPDDPVYLSNMTLKNVIVGSRYWLVQASDHSNVLATGVAVATDVVLTNLPAMESDMLVLVRVRNASGSPPYKSFDTNAYLTRSDNIVFIAQQEDI